MRHTYKPKITHFFSFPRPLSVRGISDPAASPGVSGSVTPFPGGPESLLGGFSGTPLEILNL